MENDKKSILKDALNDYKQIVEAAEINAKKKLAEEFPEKFNSLLKEELNKNKSTKESYKKIDEKKESKDDVETKKDTDMKSQEKKETNKVVKEGQPFNEKAKEVTNVKEDVKITNTVGKSDPFEETPKEQKQVEETVKIVNTVKDGKPFEEEPEKTKKSLQKEALDLKGQNVASVGTAIESAGDDDDIIVDDDDDVITMDDIEDEILKMDELDERFTDVANSESPSYLPKDSKGIAFNELIKMRNQIDEMIGNMKSVEEMHNPGKETFGSDSQIDALHKEGPTKKLVDELQDDYEITEEDINAVLGDEDEVDEAHGVGYSKRRAMPGRNLPKYDYLSQGEKDQSPEAIKESEKFIKNLIDENKKLTKKVNESIEFKKSATTLIENYKTALEKYRTQLKEMAIFNTNLAHVNNLLVNEELALTQDDKIKIINEFKNVDSIAESQKKYKSILSEMKYEKKSITETLQDKASASIAPSSKKILDEAKEITAYENNDHIKKMKRIIETIEHRGKK